jgi:PPE-repeat protein
MTITGPSGTFGDDAVICSASGTTGPCDFTRSFSFLTPAGFTLASVDISSIATSDALTDIDFSSVTLNGVAFNVLASGTQEFRNLLNQVIVAGGTNVILVSGKTGGEAAFSGNLSFAAASAVPEPTTWAMMLVGFGAVGYSMRKRLNGRTQLA